MARNLKKMGRNEETNQKGQQEQSQRGQKVQDLFRKAQFAEHRLYVGSNGNSVCMGGGLGN